MEIAPPPTVPEPNQGGWLQLLLPAVGSLGLVGFAVVSGSRIFLWIAIGIAALMVGVLVAMRVQQRRIAKRKRRDNAYMYRKYLKDQRERLEQLSRTQRAALERLHPDDKKLLSWVQTRRNLWERRRSDGDFLRARIGRGSVPLMAPVRLALSNDPLTEHEPDLLHEAEGVWALTNSCLRPPSPWISPA